MGIISAGLCLLLHVGGSLTVTWVIIRCWQRGHDQCSPFDIATPNNLNGVFDPGLYWPLAHHQKLRHSQDLTYLVLVESFSKSGSV